MILKSSDLLIDLASSLGRKLKLKDYFIGSFIVGIGTSLPELFTSIAAVFIQQPQLVVPTIYGTIVANIAAGFGLGVIALYVVRGLGRNKHHPPMAGGSLSFGLNSGPKRFLGIPIAFAVGSVVLSGLFYLLGSFGTWHAMIFLLLYGAFLLYELKKKRADKIPDEGSYSPAPAAATDYTHTQIGPAAKAWRFGIHVLPILLALTVFILVATDRMHEHLEVFRDSTPAEILYLTGLAGIALILCWLVWDWVKKVPMADFSSSVAASLMFLPRAVLAIFLGVTVLVIYYSGVAIVEAVEWTAALLGIGDTVLAASALAVGTSLPDIVVAIKVARQGRHMLLFGHILQSNTFDVFLAMGVCGLFAPLITGYSFAAGLSILCSVLFTLALLPVIWTRRITLIPGVVLVAAFLVFMGLLFT